MRRLPSSSVKTSPRVSEARIPVSSTAAVISFMWMYMSANAVVPERIISAIASFAPQ